ncbi:MAG TPA: class I SAM-dependent methyltransferase [Galbitalea sp.]|jgi:SAM-dependent methyltransferase|nr:class I SAM-dependent methyltransferase [Galbitalea sp.]
MTDAHHEHDHSSNGEIDWDARYSESEQRWSGNPNVALVDAVRDLAPGRAVDIGCGEGADAVWLARNGWDVTALDVSAVALERAARHANDTGVGVHWIHAGLLDASLQPASFNLVSAQYPVLAKTPEFAAEHILLGAVAIGGTLVIVHHADFQSPGEDHHGADPADYVGPWDIVPLLDEGWTIEVNETRPRHVASGAGAGHTEDVVLIAHRV